MVANSIVKLMKIFLFFFENKNGKMVGNDGKKATAK